MSESISVQGRAVVARSSYTRVQRLLVVAVVAIIGLTVAVILLATSQNSSTTLATDTSQNTAAQIGATLNHRGFDNSQNAAAQIGARLNHRGS